LEKKLILYVEKWVLQERNTPSYSSSSSDASMSLFLLFDILVDYSEMSLSNVVGDVTYGS
jgi:hypothetical protein